MRLISQIFQPVVTIPKGAKIKNTEITCKSQKLLLECGLVRPTSAGLFTLLPLARRAVTKIENIIHRCLEEVGAQRITLPCLTSAKLWAASGRLDDVGPELIKVEDRHGKKFLLAPTHEEAIADLLADVGPISYKQLPFTLYQIGNKYRDEQRPKHGLLRAREFSMMDAYSVHASHSCAADTYSALTRAYTKIFRTLDLPVLRVQAPTGEMGGTLSHEWQLPSSAGEDTVAVCPSCSHTTLANETEECAKCGKEIERVNSIEVSHTFVLGTRYSEPLQVNCVGPDSSAPLHMGCYGIGITRLLAAILEVLSSDKSMRWPIEVAPYSAVVIGPKEGSKEWLKHDFDRVLGVAQRIHENGYRGDVLVDDRHGLTIGKRLMMADRIGYPFIIVCGKSALETPPRYELYRSTGGEAPTPQLLTIDELLTVMNERKNNINIEYRENVVV
ncbi:probable proline--tRNA ligase, mitochondrial isoform X2 [Nymphalis io]|uniref:probable proline--tRNA ligase, mitochondrial isoform X2 n=1 Tax=Inachis io TaxID=171585 RepID=UPI0021675746|nr:probable proline--tRNA ligase, mitochondrial isoform X2 [Nymphalis io]